jgi:hypothetical protein
MDELHLGDEIRLKKPHPCGSTWWRVVRLGADIGLSCTGCGRRVLVPRAKLNRQLRQSRSGEQDAG